VHHVQAVTVPVGRVVVAVREAEHRANFTGPGESARVLAERKVGVQATEARLAEFTAISSYLATAAEYGLDQPSPDHTLRR
jgi:hypothetical protein